MIFVTVGTTHFDDLVEAVDAVAAQVAPGEEIVFQIGAGRYEPHAGRFFRYQPSIETELTEADLVVTHGGATVFALLAARKRFVAIANRSITGNHQERFLRFLGQNSSILWSAEPAAVSELIPLARTRSPAELRAPSMGQDLRRFIMDSFQKADKVRH